MLKHWFDSFLYSSVSTIRHSTQQYTIDLLNLSFVFCFDFYLRSGLLASLNLIGLIELLCRQSCFCLANDGIKCVYHYTLLYLFSEFGRNLLKRVCLGSCAMVSLWFANCPEDFFSVQWSWTYSVKLLRSFIHLCVSMSVSAPFSCFVFSLFLSHLFQTNIWEVIL